jgi:hypothetical protein
MNKISELPNHYASIEDLTLYRWDKYTQTKDNNWFLIDYDGRQTKLDSEDLKAVENDLVDQYFKAVDDRSFSSKMQKWARIDWLKRKYETCHMLLNGLTTILGFPVNEETSELRLKYVLELKKWRLNIPVLNTVYDDIILINDFKQALEGITTEIALLGKELIKEGKEESASLSKQLQIATIALSYPYRLNPKEITVMEWIEICKLVEEKAKNN